jgi:peptide/nickel transport system substrate-binding protein
MSIRHLAAAATIAFVAALASSHASAQTLRFGLNNDPDLLDPTTSRTFVGTAVMTAICDKLFDFDSTLTLVPKLATGYTWTSPTTVELKIRQGVTFHDGEKLDAAAVKYTLDRHINTPTSFRRAELSAMDKAEVIDAETLRITLKQPSQAFLAAFTDRAGMMVSPKAAEATGKDFGLHPVCAGPFAFTERVAQDHITLDRYPGYWDAKNIHFDRVIYRPMTDSAIRLANLKAGSLDMADIVPSDADSVKTDPKLQLLSSPGLGYLGISFNIGPNPLANTPIGRDARIRHAFELTIDRNVIVNVVFNGFYTPTAQAISAGSPMHVPGITPPARDIAAAKKLLKDAGVTAPVVVKLTVPNNPQSLQVSEVIQAMAKEGGFDVQPTVMDFGTALATTQRGDYAAFLIGWSGLLDADSNIYSFLHTGGPLNITTYSNKIVDAALDAARIEADPAKRRAEYAKLWAQERIDLPVMYLYTPSYLVGATAKLHGYKVLPDGLIRLQGASLAP